MVEGRKAKIDKIVSRLAPFAGHGKQFSMIVRTRGTRRLAGSSHACIGAARSHELFSVFSLRGRLDDFRSLSEAIADALRVIPKMRTEAGSRFRP